MILFLCIGWVQSAAAESREVRVGVFPAAPLVFTENGAADGLFIDLLKYFAQNSGWELTYVEGTWSDLLLKLKTGEIDILPAIGYTEERTKIYDFSKHSVYIDTGVLFTEKNHVLNTVFEIQDKKVAAVKGSIFTDGFLSYIDAFGVSCEIIFTEDNAAVMAAISNHEVDLGVSIYSLGNELAKTYPVSVTPLSFTPIALGFAVPAGRNADIINAIDSMMDLMKGDPDSFYSRTFNKWSKPDFITEIPQWILWLLGMMLLTGLFLILWNITLKRQVSSKTKILISEITVRKDAENELRLSLREKDALIHELYHRTKNTLQMITGIIVLQAQKYPDSKDMKQFVTDINSRIQAVALVHQLLYQVKEISRIPISEYIKDLSDVILGGIGADRERIILNIGIAVDFIPIEIAVPLGLIINELMTNTLMHAFPDGRKGTITCSLSQSEENEYSLYYSDDGIGVPDGFNFNSRKTLGMRIIHSICEKQLRGRVKYETGEGIAVTVTIPSDTYKTEISRF